MASWPLLISYLLVAPAYLHVVSDWPRTFFTPKVFLFSIHYYNSDNMDGILELDHVNSWSKWRHRRFSKSLIRLQELRDYMKFILKLSIQLSDNGP